MRDDHDATVIEGIGDLGLESKNLVEVGTGQHGAGLALSDDRPLLHGDQVVGHAGGQV